MRDSFVKQLSSLAEQDPRVMLITGDLGFGVLTEYAQRFPRQFINAGVAEQNMTGLATGLALEGHIVFTYSIANFTFMRCLEQIRNDAAYHQANVNVVSVGGGFSYGALGISHHATEDLAMMRCIPEMTVVCPGDDWETIEATRQLASTPGASYLRLDKSTAGWTQQPGECFELGKSRRLREGSDLTLIATGGILEQACLAADHLAQRGVESRVLSVHTLSQVDVEALRSAARQTGGIITIEEHRVEGGLGGMVAEYLLESGDRPAFFHRIGLRGGFASVVGSQAYLRQHYELDCEAIVRAACQQLDRSATFETRREQAA